MVYSVLWVMQGLYHQSSVMQPEQKSETALDNWSLLEEALPSSKGTANHGEARISRLNRKCLLLKLQCSGLWFRVRRKMPFEYRAPFQSESE